MKLICLHLWFSDALFLREVYVSWVKYWLDYFIYLHHPFPKTYVLVWNGLTTTYSTIMSLIKFSTVSTFSEWNTTQANWQLSHVLLHTFEEKKPIYVQWPRSRSYLFQTFLNVLLKSLPELTALNILITGVTQWRHLDSEKLCVTSVIDKTKKCVFSIFLTFLSSKILNIY